MASREIIPDLMNVPSKICQLRVATFMYKEIEIINRLFVVIAMYCQDSSINHSISRVDS